MMDKNKGIFMVILTATVIFLTMIYTNRLPSVEDQIKNRVVKISVQSKNEVAHGTGTHLGDGLILTNAHLFPQTGEASIYVRGINDSANEQAVIVSSTTKADFAIIRVKNKYKRTHFYIEENWKLGEPLILLGNPIDKDFVVGHTTITAYELVRNPLGYTRFMLLYPCDTGGPGFSGSAVYNAKGDLLGIHELSMGGDGAMCAAIPAHEILSYLLHLPLETK